MDKIEVVGIYERAKGVWAVTFDGRPLGDARGHDKAGAEAEARKFVADERRWAARDNRPVFLTLSPDIAD